MTADEFIAIAGMTVDDMNSPPYFMAMAAASAITEFEKDNAIVGQTYSSRGCGGRYYVAGTASDGREYGVGVMVNP